MPPASSQRSKSRQSTGPRSRSKSAHAPARAGKKRTRAPRGEALTTRQALANVAADSGRQLPGAAAKWNLEKYERGLGTNIHSVRRAPVKRDLQHAESLATGAVVSAARAELLLAADAGMLEAEGMEKTHKFSQAEIKAAVPSSAATSALTLAFPDEGPVRARYTRNGRYMAIASATGHVALVDALRHTSLAELHLREVVHDLCWLHNHSFWAAAQARHVYIYDHRGTEIHVLRDHKEPKALTFLPHHFLLATIGTEGRLRYLDTSDGRGVAEFYTGHGAASVLGLNQWNAVVGVGHGNGLVTQWTPNMGKPVAQLAAHKGPVRAMAFDPSGTYMVTTGADARMKVWDVRMWRQLHSYFTDAPAVGLDISQRGMLAVGFNSHVQVWADALAQKAKSPYMRVEAPGHAVAAKGLAFRPYEDILGIGWTDQFQAAIVPGSGEPNYDTLAADPFQDAKARRETEVAALLDKVPATAITLNPDEVGAVDRATDEVRQSEKAEAAAALAAAAGPARVKNKARGRSKATRMEAKKQIRNQEAGRTARKDQVASRHSGKAGREPAPGKPRSKAGAALGRFS